MVDQLARPKEHTEIYWFSEQPYGHVTDEDIAQYDSGRLGFPNTFFDPERASILYNQYHEQYQLADEVNFDGIFTAQAFAYPAEKAMDSSRFMYDRINHYIVKYWK